MKLDTRIINGKRPLTCFDTDEAKDYVGKKCYFTNKLREYADLTTVTAKRTLGRVGSYFYAEFDSGMYAYCLPCEWVTETKEKKYRPYTLEEFLNEGFEILVLVNKETGSEYHVRYNGFIKKVNGNCRIILGNVAYTLKELFECYTYLDSDGIFKPFGVEE